MLMALPIQPLRSFLDFLVKMDLTLKKLIKCIVCRGIKMNRLILGVVLFAILLISPLTWAGYLGKTNNYNCDLDDMRTFDYGYGWEFHSGYIAEQIAVAKGAGRV